MEKIINPYKIVRRTDYSKLRVFDIENNRYIENEISEKILSDYDKQMSNPEKYFDMNGNILLRATENIINEDIKYVFIPDFIQVISTQAFRENKILSISFSDMLQEIEEYAFVECTKLTHLNIPKNVKKIGFGAFKDCYGLIEANLPNIKIMNQHLFSDCFSLKKITIPDSVEIIKDYVFKDCTALEEVEMSSNLKSIENFSFAGCKNLSKIDFPESLKIIGEGAFSGCGSMDKLILPDSVEKIGRRAFSNCSELTFVKLPSNLKELPYKMFMKCRKLEHITLPDSLESIGEWAFEQVETLKNINIPRNLNVVTGFHFTDSNIESITFNYDLRALESREFGPIQHKLIGDSRVHKIVINEGVSKIIPEAFCEFGLQITEVEFLGTRDGFEKFKKNNEKLFNILPNAKINIIEQNLEKNMENVR